MCRHCDFSCFAERAAPRTWQLLDGSEATITPRCSRFYCRVKTNRKKSKDKDKSECLRMSVWCLLELRLKRHISLSWNEVKDAPQSLGESQSPQFENRSSAVISPSQTKSLVLRVNFQWHKVAAPTCLASTRCVAADTRDHNTGKRPHLPPALCFRNTEFLRTASGVFCLKTWLCEEWA